MPRSTRSNPTNLVIDHAYEQRIAAIKVGAAAGAALGESFGNYLASGASERLGAGILKGLGDKATELKRPIQKKKKKPLCQKPSKKARPAAAR